MPFNPNPFTEFQLKLLRGIREKLIEIRNPDKEVLDDKDFSYYVENSKKFGPIPKLRFKPNAQAIKHEIMTAAGYKPIAKKSSHKERIEAGATAFNKHWDSMMAGLIKSTKRIAIINQTFVEEGQLIAEIIRLIQMSITTKSHNRIIHNPNNTKEESYIDQINNTL
ncbi:uncharacterized protein Dvar_08590 [Desulfosarcina variabilis str. Montpellier]|uniref:hypothetical protein n=1 Tax=Desulfosarcina variabilis TaxID=2300 RepID=UPI003AFADD7D